MFRHDETSYFMYRKLKHFWLQKCFCYTNSMKSYQNSKIIHIPVGVGGYVIDTLAILFLATVVVAADRNSHSVSDMFYAIFPYIGTTFLLREWLAHKLS
jgi:hypothetical protein